MYYCVFKSIFILLFYTFSNYFALDTIQTLKHIEQFSANFSFVTPRTKELWAHL